MNIQINGRKKRTLHIHKPRIVPLSTSCSLMERLFSSEENFSLETETHDSVSFSGSPNQSVDLKICLPLVITQPILKILLPPFLSFLCPKLRLWVLHISYVFIQLLIYTFYWFHFPENPG